MITIVDYGLGNIRAFLNIYRRLNIDARTASTPEALVGASKLILPGVGAFDHAMEQLERSGMRPTLEDLVTVRRVPILGVCVGMQMLGRSSEEGALPGLGWIGGSVKAFGTAASSRDLPVPHMGWNDVRPKYSSPLFKGFDADARFYFLHSYYFECDRKDEAIAVSTYGFEFASAVNAGNVFGVQFHPEKSHSGGTRLLQNFAEL